LQFCLLEFCPLSQRRLFWSVQCHINFTRGSVIRLRGAVAGLKRAGLSRLQSQVCGELYVAECGSDLPKSDSGTFLGPLLRLAGRMTLLGLPASQKKGGIRFVSDCPVRTHLHASCRDRTGSPSLLRKITGLTPASSSDRSADQIPFHIFKFSDLDQFQGLNILADIAIVFM